MRKPTKKTISLILSTLLFLLAISLKANNTKKPLLKEIFISKKLNSFNSKSNEITFEKNNDIVALKEKINLTRTDKGKIIFQLRSNGYLRNQDITISTV